MDTIGIVLNVLIVLVIIFPIPVTIIGVATQLDPFYFIFEQLLLPHPYYRSIQLIVLIPLIRIFIGYFCVVEFLRFSTFAVFGVVIGVFAVYSISEKLTHVFYDKSFMLFNQLRIGLAVTENLTNFFAAVFIFGFQFATILVLWVLFNCYHLLSIFIYIIGCCLVGYLILLIAMVLPTITQIHTQTKNLIKTKLKLYFSVGRKYSQKYYYYTLWKSQRIVYLSCYNFFIIQKEVTMLYWKELIANLADAILLISPEIM